MRHPNLVLVTIECWRGDHFGILTPHLSILGEESLRFSEAYTPGGWTLIAMTALMSSAYASMHGGGSIGLSTPARRTLAECLLERGYWTAGFTTNPVCGGATGFQRGFAVFSDVQREKPRLPSGAPSEPKKDWESMAGMGISVRDTQATVDARGLTDRAVRWLNTRDSNQPFFLWLHYLDPHWPCQMTGKPLPQEDLLNAWRDYATFHNQVVPSRGTFDPGQEARLRWASRYRECVTAADQEIGRLIGALRIRPDWDQTIVAVTGDHGEELFERGTWHHGWNQLHREGIQVPLLIRVPGSDPRLISAPVGLVDLAPTLLDFAGIDAPPAMIGRTLRPLTEGENCSPRPVFTEMMSHFDSAIYRLAIRDGEWKYIYDLENPHSSKLFRIPDDPEERVNLRDSCSDVLRRFEQMRLAHTTLGLTRLMGRPRAMDPGGHAIRPNGPEPALANPGLSGQNIVREQLEALGYL